MPLEAQTVKKLPAVQETRVQSLGQEDPLEEAGAPLQDSCLENPMGRGAWRDTVHGVSKSRTGLRDTFTENSDFNISSLGAGRTQFSPQQRSSRYVFKNLCLFIYLAALGQFQHAGSSLYLSLCCTGSLAEVRMGSVVVAMSLVAPRQVGSLSTPPRDQTRAPGINRQILNPWTTGSPI